MMMGRGGVLAAWATWLAAFLEITLHWLEVAGRAIEEGPFLAIRTH